MKTFSHLIYFPPTLKHPQYSFIHWPHPPSTPQGICPKFSVSESGEIITITTRRIVYSVLPRPDWIQLTQSLHGSFIYLPSSSSSLHPRTVPKEDSQILFDGTHVSSYVVNPFSGQSPFRQIGAQLPLCTINQSLNRSHGLPATEDWDLTQSNPQTNNKQEGGLPFSFFYFSSL